MSWEDVDQRRSGGDTALAACTLSLVARQTHMRLWCSINAEVRASLAWEVGQPLVLQMGRGAQAGWVRILPGAPGRLLRALPRSPLTSIELTVPEDLARWQGMRKAAEHQVLKGGILVCRLPWDLPYDSRGFVLPPPDDAGAEAVAEDGAEAAAA